MRRVNVNRPLFTRSSSSCFPIHLSICSFVADTVSMNVGPVLFFSSFCDIVFSSVVFFCAVDMHVAVANKTNNYIETTVWNFSYLHKKFCICGMVQYFQTFTLIDLVFRVVHWFSFYHLSSTHSSLSWHCSHHFKNNQERDVAGITTITMTRNSLTWRKIALLTDTWAYQSSHAKAWFSRATRAQRQA